MVNSGETYYLFESLGIFEDMAFILNREDSLELVTKKASEVMGKQN